MHRHNNTSGACQQNPSAPNAQILERETSDNPFLTPPEAFVKDQPDLYQPTNRWVPNVVGVTTQQDIDIDVDVIIVGAGISGLGAAYRLSERNPHLTYAILERRAQIGGTWDLFRYPGVRSDSSMFTLSFPWSRGPARKASPTASTSAST